VEIEICLNFDLNFRNGLIDKQHRLNMLLGIKHQPVETLPEPAVEDHHEEPQYSEEPTDEEHMYEHEDTTDEACQIKLERFESEEYQEAPSEMEMIEEDGEEAVTSEAEEIGEQFDDEEMETTIDQLEEYQIDENSESYQVCYEEEEEYVEYGGEISMTESAPKRKYTKHTKDTSKPYKCWIKNCGATFAFRTTMKKHMHLNHSIVCQKSTCFICGNSYDEYADFLAHVKGHTRKSQCDICKLTFVNDEKLEAHKGKFHKGDDEGRNFQCNICSAKFKRKEHLNSHIVYKHSDKNARKFPCKDCASSFLTRQDLKNHEKSHSQVKINCIYCSYNCRDLKSIRRHCQKLHNTEKIYKCPCEQTFEFQREMQTHKKNCTGSSVLIDSTTEY
jgi:hypothetical protein